MPKIARQVEQDVDVFELNEELVKYGADQIQGGVYLPSDIPNERGEQIIDFDTLVPVDTLYDQGLVARDTHVVAVKVVPEAGIVWGAFFGPDGAKRMQFFSGGAFKEILPRESKPKGPGRRGPKSRK